MNEKLEKQLVESYQKLFPDTSSTEEHSCMCYGCQCNDGWFKIIDEACKKLSKFSEYIYLSQIKEKFGELRIYYDYRTDVSQREKKTIQDALVEITTEASNQSLKQCEICGEKANFCVRLDGKLFKTLCSKHQSDMNYSVYTNLNELVETSK